MLKKIAGIIYFITALYLIKILTENITRAHGIAGVLNYIKKNPVPWIGTNNVHISIILVFVLMDIFIIISILTSSILFMLNSKLKIIGVILYSIVFMELFRFFVSTNQRYLIRSFSWLVVNSIFILICSNFMKKSFQKK